LRRARILPLTNTLIRATTHDIGVFHSAAGCARNRRTIATTTPR